MSSRYLTLALELAQRADRLKPTAEGERFGDFTDGDVWEAAGLELAVRGLYLAQHRIEDSVQPADVRRWVEQGRAARDKRRTP